MRKLRAAALLLCAVALASLSQSESLAQDNPGAGQGGGWLSLAQAAPAGSGPAAKVDGGGSTSAPGSARAAAAPGSPGAAETAEADPDEKPWEVRFKVYGWLPDINGHAGVNRAISTVDVDFRDLMHSLDEIESFVPINLEARYDHFGFYADLLYVQLEDQVNKGPVTVKLKAAQTILELAGFYRVGTWALEPKCGKSVTVDVIGGARYNRLEGDVGIETPRRAIGVGGVQEWWDPIVGSRVIWQAGEKLSAFARGDVGGLGLANSSHFSWQFQGGLEYDFTKNIFMEVGYRLLDTDFESTHGARHFTYDILMAGPYTAFGVKF